MATSINRKRKLLLNKFDIICNHLYLIISLTIILLYLSNKSSCTPINNNSSFKDIQKKYSTLSDNNRNDRKLDIKHLSRRSQQVASVRKLIKRATVINNPINKSNSTTIKPLSNQDIVVEKTRELVPVLRQQQLISRNINNRTNNSKQKISPKLNLDELFREDVANYPEKKIELILKRTPNELKDLFNVLNTPLDPNNNLTERVATYHHDNDNDNDSDGNYEAKEENVCRMKTKNIYPRQALDRNNVPRMIINNNHFMQVIQAEICELPNEECNYLQNNLPNGMISSCQQKYAYKKLLYIEDNETKSDLFTYPSCCSCFVKHTPFDLRTSNRNSISPLSDSNNNNNNNKNSPFPLDSVNNSTGDDPSTDTLIIPINTSTTIANNNNKRQPKSLSPKIDKNSSTRQKTTTQPTIIIDTSIEDQIFNGHNNNINLRDNNNHTTRVSKYLNSTQHTVILGEDRVYNPDG